MNKQFIVISALCAFVVGAPVYAEEVLPSKGSLFAKKPTLFAQYRGIQNGLGDNHEPFTLIYSRFLNEKSVKVTTDEKMVLFEELEHRGVTPLMLGKVRLFSRSVDKELKRFPWLAVGLTAAAFIGVAIAIMYQRHAQVAPPADGEASGLATEGTQSSWLASTSWGKAISKWWYGDVAAQPDDNTPPRPHANSDASGEADGGGRSVPPLVADPVADSGTSEEGEFAIEITEIDKQNEARINPVAHKKVALQQHSAKASDGIALSLAQIPNYRERKCCQDAGIINSNGKAVVTDGNGYCSMLNQVTFATVVQNTGRRVADFFAKQLMHKGIDAFDASFMPQVDQDVSTAETTLAGAFVRRDGDRVLLDYVGAGDAGCIVLYGGDKEMYLPTVHGALGGFHEKGAKHDLIPFELHDLKQQRALARHLRIDITGAKYVILGSDRVFDNYACGPVTRAFSDFKDEWFDDGVFSSEAYRATEAILNTLREDRQFSAFYAEPILLDANRRAQDAEQLEKLVRWKGAAEQKFEELDSLYKEFLDQTNAIEKQLKDQNIVGGEKNKRLREDTEYQDALEGRRRIGAEQEVVAFFKNEIEKQLEAQSSGGKITAKQLLQALEAQKALGGNLAAAVADLAFDAQVTSDPVASDDITAVVYDLTLPSEA